MRLSADEILLQYPLYRTQIEEVLARLEEACAEDLYKNSDMFEPERPTISGRPHPNATMRALEQHLGAEDADFLLFLSALVAAGREVCDGLATCRDREEMAALISLSPTKGALTPQTKRGCSPMGRFSSRSTLCSRS